MFSVLFCQELDAVICFVIRKKSVLSFIQQTSGILKLAHKVTNYFFLSFRNLRIFAILKEALTQKMTSTNDLPNAR